MTVDELKKILSEYSPKLGISSFMIFIIDGEESTRLHYSPVVDLNRTTKHLPERVRRRADRGLRP